MKLEWGDFLIKLNIDINVKNHDEIIKKNKGSLVSGVASVLGISKNKVEDEIKKQVKKTLQKSIKEQLDKNGVDADVSVY